MDRIKETSDVIIRLNKFRKGEITDFAFISSVCSYFDAIKNEQLHSNDYKFLKYIANVSGIPHFYNILEKFEQNPSISNFDLNSFSSLLYESTLHTDENRLLHKYQKEIVDKFENKKVNRYFLSASTSFGKTHLVFEIIRKMNYSNIVLIFPTIALLSENLEKLISDSDYLSFQQNYEIHTLSDVKEYGRKNLFIYTPERYLSFIDKSNNAISFDFVFIDEVYKIDNEYLIDNEVRENERDVAYRLAVFYSLQSNVDVLLAGPYMEFPKDGATQQNNSFSNFLSDNQIELVDYNNYEIVNKTFHDIRGKKLYPIDEHLNIEYLNQSKTTQLSDTIKQILSIGQNSIIYCANRGKNGGVEYYANILNSTIEHYDYSQYIDLVNHISDVFSDNWILVKSLKQGIGIHHGLVPKYIQKEIINLFNQGSIKILISTTTITEGVNTSAKNLVVLHSQKGNKKLKKFDAKNIAGRAGRFGFHYSGRVIDLSKEFSKIIASESEVLRHKNYDLKSPKDEIDLFYSDEKYLNIEDKRKKEGIKAEQLSRNIPESILAQYKVVSRADKIKIFDAINNLNAEEIKSIKNLVRVINYKLNIDYKGFQLILNLLSPIIKNSELKGLIDTKKDDVNSILTHLVYYYLSGGFMGSVRYYSTNKGEHIDTAISKTAKFIYNTLKYQTVKYLGVFNVMYKYHISTSEHIPYEEVNGIDRLLLKFEYNALTEEGRIASDYGVPSKIVDYYESESLREIIKESFDDYELKVFEKVDKVIRN